MPTPTKPSGPWPVVLRSQFLAQLIAGAWSIQAEQTEIHQKLHRLKERLEDAFNQ
ncbi:hypothetical protein PAXRUDRAFT_18984 [Paxillus rubicundulus Ve08.2h10]|uniref:Uncharacterized protein n=1 Tax=Paxillus rubicundulus Ve08.2h10 TaxID=930991 RepID=A0A0D0CJX4_9AGAM|nr:hypothetical protein PAXRUDRAFT_18984 [Paxillus rubicundulus Ve08.2h10]